MTEENKLQNYQSGSLYRLHNAPCTPRKEEKTLLCNILQVVEI